MKRLSRLLLDKSQEAFLLSLEIYNKPTIQYRLESFCFFFTNAWELLLKAYLIESTKIEKTIFYSKVKGQPQKSITLRDALKKIFHNEKDPIRKNIDDIANLRDEATHLIIQELESVYVGLFQAGVLNYLEKLKEWFGISITDRISPAMLSLIFDVDKVDPIILRKKHGKKVADFFTGKMTEIENNISDLKDKRYSISIEYKLALVKNPKHADITLSPGLGEKFSGTIIEVAKDPSITHPYRRCDCIKEVKARIDQSIFFNSYDFQGIVAREKISSKPELYYKSKTFGNKSYSPKLIEFIVNKIEQNPEYLVTTRNWYNNYRSQRKKKD